MNISSAFEFLTIWRVNQPVGPYWNSPCPPAGVVTWGWGDWQTRGQHHLHGNATMMCREPERHKCIVMSLRPRGSLSSPVWSCAYGFSSRYIGLAITACFISNYTGFSSDIQHLLGEMICMLPNDRVGLATYCLLIHCLSSLIAARANTRGGVIRQGDTIFPLTNLTCRGISAVAHIKVSGVYSQVFGAITNLSVDILSEETAGELLPSKKSKGGGKWVRRKTRGFELKLWAVFNTRPTDNVFQSSQLLFIFAGSLKSTSAPSVLLIHLLHVPPLYLPPELNTLSCCLAPTACNQTA